MNHCYESSRRTFLKWMGLSGAAMTLVGGRKPLPAHMERKPNFIFIMVDDMGYADLGCYGSKVIRTPNIDRMAKEGMRFTQAYSGCTVCAPARSTLMTGKHMGHTEVRGNTGGIPLPADAKTIAEVLKKSGYATGGFGKWGLGDIGTTGVPEQHGFDTFYGYYHQIHAHSYYPEYLIRNGKKERLPTNAGGKKGQYSHTLIFEETLKFIRANQDRPFFCYAPWTPPHGSYVIPESDPAWQQYKDQLWPRDPKVIAAMDGMIDRQVGQVLDLLKELELDEHTLVFFCSDNGATHRFVDILDSSGPLRGRKRDMYEGGIRTPMIAWWPGRIEPGAVNDLPWYFPDVFPTLAELAEADGQAQEGIDGISIVPTLLGKDGQKRHEYLYWEWPAYNWGKRNYPRDGLMQALRAGDWKLLRHRSSKPFELYNLATDIGERKNLAEAHPEIVKKLEAMINRAHVAPSPQLEPKMPEGRPFR